IWMPANGGDEDDLLVVVQLGPAHCPFGDRSDAELDARIGFAGPRIRRRLHDLADAGVIHDGRQGDTRLIGAQESGVAAVRGPPVTPPTAMEKLLEIDPARLAVEDQLGAVACQGSFRLRRQVLDMQVVVADEGASILPGTDRYQLARSLGLGGDGSLP